MCEVAIRTMTRCGAVNGIAPTCKKKEEFCTGCVYGRSRRALISQQVKVESTVILQNILCGRLWSCTAASTWWAHIFCNTYLRSFKVLLGLFNENKKWDAWNLRTLADIGCKSVDSFLTETTN